jgi:hypothetical protein
MLLQILCTINIKWDLRLLDRQHCTMQGNDRNNYAALYTLLCIFDIDFIAVVGVDWL